MYDIDRLGLAYCRLNCFEWDEILGEKPEGFDNLPNYTPRNHLFKKRKMSKMDYIDPPIRAIESIIGRANTSRCWWKYELKLSEEDWFKWYTGRNGPFSEEIRVYTKQSF